MTILFLALLVVIQHHQLLTLGSGYDPSFRPDWNDPDGQRRWPFGVRRLSVTYGPGWESQTGLVDTRVGYQDEPSLELAWITGWLGTPLG